MKANVFLGISMILSNFIFSQFTIYNTSNSGLGSNNCDMLGQHPNGDIWVATVGGGASKFDGTNWTVYNTSNSAISGNSLLAVGFNNTDVWLGTNNSGGGVSVYNGSSWTTYNTSNSGLSGNDIICFTRDISGNMWVATRFNGICKFNGTNWTSYTTSNSGIPANQVYRLEADPAGGVWVGFATAGLAKFDGINNWTIYNVSNSSLPANDVYCIKYNTASNSLWVGTSAGLAIKTGTVWAVHSATNTNFPNNYVRGIDFNYASGNAWICTGYGGIGKWDGVNWTKYTTSNSNLPSNTCWWLKAGTQNKVWVTTSGTSPSGIVTISDVPVGTDVSIHEREEINLSVYPNPASNYAHISIVSEVGGNGVVIIRDNLGKEITKKQVHILAGKQDNAITLDLGSLSSGFYFCTLEFNNSTTVKKFVKD